MASFTPWRRTGSLILSGFWCMLAILGGIQDGAVTPGFAFRAAWGELMTRAILLGLLVAGVFSLHGYAAEPDGPASLRDIAPAAAR